MPITYPLEEFSQAIQFNTGFLDINGFRVATLQDITINAGFTLKQIGAVGTIKTVVAPKRQAWRPSCKFKALSVNQALLGFLWGSSILDGSGWDYNLIDGQVVLSSVVVSALTNDNAAQMMQYQFINAVFGSASIAYKMDGAAEFDLEIQAQDLGLVTNYVDVNTPYGGINNFLLENGQDFLLENGNQLIL